GPLTVVFDDVSLGATSSRWYYREKSPSIGAWIPFDGIDTTFYNSSAVTKVFDVRVEVKSGDNCNDSDTAQITVYPEVIADFSADQYQGCGPLAVEFTNL